MLGRRRRGCVAALGALALVPVVGVSAAPDGALTTPLRLHAASLRQDGRLLVLGLATSRPWSPASLRRERRSPPLPIGCTASRSGGYVRHVAGRRRVVALTFDDGPWPDTPAFLGVLERERVPATFFMIGRQVAGHGALIRRMLSDGDVVGDHTWDHANVAGGGAFAAGEIGSAATAIQRAGGFRPCLFRPPYGAVSPALTRLARGLGFATIGWDVDPSDWATPGTPAIESRILSAVTSGSIVLMHDGGGPRGQTLAALPHVIGVLRARRYRFLTVAALTGATLRY